MVSWKFCVCDVQSPKSFLESYGLSKRHHQHHYQHHRCNNNKNDNGDANMRTKKHAKDKDECKQRKYFIARTSTSTWCEVRVRQRITPEAIL